MRVRNWNPKKYDNEFANASMDRLREAANVVSDTSKQKLKAQIGKGKTTGISRPPYQTGKYAGQPWTARNFGQLHDSIRVVEKIGSWGFEPLKNRNVRIYAGHYLAYYAKIFEFSRPFMRPAWRASLPKIKAALKAK